MKHTQMAGIAQLLLDSGASISSTNNAGNQKNYAGNSPLDFALKVGWKPLIDVLEKP